MTRTRADLLTISCLVLLTGCGGGGGDAPAPPPAPAPTPPPAVNQNPVASFTSTAALVAGEIAVLDAGASTDPEGGALTYHWSFGDDGRGGSARIAHIFSDAGRYTIRLRVTDPQGAMGEVTREITVSEPAVARFVTAQGVVTTLAGAPLGDVVVRAQGSPATAQTNGQGRVSLPMAVGRSVTLRFSKDGYADQIQRIELPATSGADASFEVAMMARAPAQTLADAAAGGTVAGAQGARLTLPANSLVTATGVAVSGAVQVSITPVDINSPALAAFPGRFAGVNGDGSQTPIVSYGTTEFVLTQSGHPLQLRAGARATLELPLYAGSNLDGTPLAAGGTLPLWSLDERSGLWVNEGEGVLVASTAAPAELVMRAEVAHLSYWNADKGFPPFRPKPRCINDVPGQYDSIFEQATICKMLAEMDKSIPAQGKQSSAGPTRIAKEVPPAYRFPSARLAADLPMAGGIPFNVPADFNLVLTASALNGTWRGQVRTRGRLDETPDVIVPLRPVTQGSPDESITLPFDDARTSPAPGVTRHRFMATAGQGVSVVVAQASSTLTGWVRLRNAAGEILITAPFGADAASFEFRFGQGGEYLIEVDALTNAPGAYRLTATQQEAVERVPSITLTDATEVGVAKLAANASGLTYALWPELRGTDTQLRASRFLSNVTGWSAPETVATITGYASTVPIQAAIDGAGNVFALWDSGDGPVVSRRAADVWSAPQALDAANCTGGGLHRLAVNGAGDAMVVWARAAATGFCARRFSAASTTWAPPHVFDMAQAQAQLSLDLADNGEAAVAWSEGGNGVPLSSHWARYRNGAWEAPATLGAANASAPGVALTPDGGVLAHWQSSSRGVEAVWQPAGGGLSSSLVLGTNSGGFYLPRVAKRTQSHLQIIWWAEGLGLVSRELDMSAQTWGAAQAIVPARASSAANVAVAGGAGRSVVLWWANKLSGTGSDFGYSSFDAASAWNTPGAVLTPRPMILNQATTFPDSASVVIDGNGAATLLWREFLAPGRPGALLRAARLPAIP